MSSYVFDAGVQVAGTSFIAPKSQIRQRPREFGRGGGPHHIACVLAEVLPRLLTPAEVDQALGPRPRRRRRRLDD